MDIPKRSGYRSEQGFSLVEIAIVFAILSVFIALVPPNAARLYRSAIVEYETQRFVSEVRYVQRLSRTTEEEGDRGLPTGKAGVPELRVLEGENQYVLASIGGASPMRYLKTYTLHRGAQLRLVSDHDRQGRPISVRFTSDGLVDQDTWGRFAVSYPGYTFHIFMEGHPDEGSRVIIDNVGRIRVERSDTQKYKAITQ